MQHFPYRSPLDRGFLSRSLLTAFDAKHPRAIVLDYLFDQPTEKAKDDEAARERCITMKTPLVVSYFEAGSDGQRRPDGLSQRLRAGEGSRRRQYRHGPDRYGALDRSRAESLKRRLSAERAAPRRPDCGRRDTERTSADRLAR